MGDVTEMRSAFRLSISQIATEFGMARATISKRIEALGIRPDGKKAGYPVYRMRDIVPVVMEQYAEMGLLPSAPDFDPSNLPPTDRRAWYQSENERLKAEADQGRLIPAAEVEAEMSAIAKAVVRALETLPDRVERDCRCSPEVVEYLQQQVHEVRQELTQQIEDLDAGEIRASG